MENKVSATFLWEGECLVLERSYNTLLPYLFYILGGLSALVGLFTIDEGGAVGLLFGIVAIIIGAILKTFCKVHLVVTTKRVFADLPFGRRMNLPLNRTTAVGTAMFRSLYIGSSSGRIYLSLVPNHLEVYNALTALLNQVE